MTTIVLLTLFAVVSFSICFLVFLFIYGQSIKGYFYQTLDKNFYFLRNYHIEYYLVLSSLIVFFIIYLSFFSILYAFASVAVYMVFFYFVLKVINDHINKKIEKDIPLFLRLLAAGLQSGLSIAAALQETVGNWQGPLKREMGLLLRELQFGGSLTQGLRHLRERLPIAGVVMMSLSLEVALTSGGSVAPLLNAIADTINQKVELQQKINTLTFQGKLQAMLLTIIPYFLLLVLYWLDSSWLAPFFETWIGNLVLVFCVLMSAVGFMVINKMTKIKF